MADQGKQVTVIEMMDYIAKDVDGLTRALLLERMAEKGIVALTRSKAREITAEGVILEREDGKEEVIYADTVILAVGSKPKNELVKSLEEEGIPTYVIGDSVKPRTIMDAIHEGFRVAYSV